MPEPWTLDELRAYVARLAAVALHHDQAEGVRPETDGTGSNAHTAPLVAPMLDQPCQGTPDLCGAPTGTLCEPWCPSWATPEGDHIVWLITDQAGPLGLSGAVGETYGRARPSPLQPSSEYCF